MLPFQAPPSTPAIMPPIDDMMLQLDPSMIIEMLTQHEPKFKPKYPAGFKKENIKKPDPKKIWQDAVREEQRNQSRTNRMMDTLRRLRFDTSGVFESDQAARALGDQDPYISSDLVDDWNLLCAIMSSMEEGYYKLTMQRSQRSNAQTLEDAVKFFREEEIYRFAKSGDMPLPMAESKVLSSYGMIASRHLCDLKNPDYPFKDSIVDPASLFFVPGGVSGPKKVYRMMRMPLAQAFIEWGEPKKSDREKLHNNLGRDDESVFITVCEYADEWYRSAVTKDGVELLPVVEHKYGYVPFVIQGGPAGEPLFTDTAQAGLDSMYRAEGGWHRSGPADDWGMEHKLVSSIHLQRDRHDQLEAFMSRVVTAAMDATNPAVIVTRDNLSSGPLPKIDRRRGMVNELGMGESVQAVPTTINPSDSNAIFNMLNQDRQTGAIPLGMFGAQVGSNNSGNSMSSASESGMDHITPWIKAMELYQTRKAEMRMMHFRNFGHLTRFSDAEERPFMVPVSKPTTSSELGQALTPELIDAIGPRVKISLTRLRINEIMQWSSAGATLIQNGVMTRRRLAEKIGEHDYDRLKEEWQEEQDWDQMNALPEFKKALMIPMRIKKWAEEAQSPEERSMFMALLDHWMEWFAIPQIEQLTPQPQMPGIPGSLSGGGQGGLPPSSPTGGPMQPPTADGINFAALGQAPGSQGGAVGRPSGPFSPPQY